MYERRPNILKILNKSVKLKWRIKLVHISHIKFLINLIYKNSSSSLRNDENR